MKNIRVLVLAVLIVCLLYLTIPFDISAQSGGDIIPPDRRIDWNPGVPDGIPEVPVVVNVLDYGAVADNSTDNRIAFQDAIAAAASAGGGAVWVPSGTYRFTSANAYNSTIDLRPGVVLRGAGREATHLVFDFAGAEVDAIKILAWNYGEFVSVVGGYAKGSTTLTLSDASSIAAGDFAEIQEENDALISNESWSLDAVGEMVEVVSVNGNQISLAEPLHYAYEASRNPVIRRVGVIDHAGVERMHLQREDTGRGQMILIYNAAYCWVREVESENITYTHFMGINSYKCEIRDNYVHHARGYGSGGQGYGVDLEKHVTDFLVENNLFQSLRHAMVAQIGASGNVFAYNYSRDPYADGGTWTPADISLHGHYASYNLIEGNVFQEGVASDAWGPTGPGNTFLRNCVQAEGVQLYDYSHRQNLVGNELGSYPNTIRPDAGVEYTLIHGNYEEGAITWDPGIANHTIPTSYYLDGVPRFFGSINWPATGSDMGDRLGECLIPARSRWQSGDPIPQPFNLTADDNGSAIDLKWLHRYGNVTYEVWRDITPYFDPAAPGPTSVLVADNILPPAIGDAMQFSDPNAPSDHTIYYKVRGFEGGSTFSAPSQSVGCFIFEMQPGG